MIGLGLAALFSVLLAAFDPTSFKRSSNKTLQSDEERVDFIFDMKAEGASILVGSIVKRGTDPLNQIGLHDGTNACVGQVIGFWYPNGHKDAGVYENNPAVAIPDGADCRVAARQSGIVSTFLLPTGITVGYDEILKVTTSGRVTNIGGTPTVAEAILPHVVSFDSKTSAANDEPMFGRWE